MLLALESNDFALVYQKCDLISFNFAPILSSSSLALFYSYSASFKLEDFSSLSTSTAVLQMDYTSLALVYCEILLYLRVGFFKDNAVLLVRCCHSSHVGSPLRLPTFWKGILSLCLFFITFSSPPKRQLLQSLCAPPRAIKS